MADQDFNSEAMRIERVWKLLLEEGCLPFAASIRDFVPEDRAATPEETRELQIADSEADAKNREFCRRLVEVATPVRVSSVGDSMPLDTLIKVGMLADVEGHGDGLRIERISITYQPRRDPAAEGTGRELEAIGDATAVEVAAIEAALLPYAVFDFGKGGWCYGRQVRAVREQ